jgi:hypothetical protein
MYSANAKRGCVFTTVLFIFISASSCERRESSNSVADVFELGPPSFPMPRSEYLARVNSDLIKACELSKSRYNLDREKCISMLTESMSSCFHANPFPMEIINVEQYKIVEESYLACATPYVSCNGIELKITDTPTTICK